MLKFDHAVDPLTAVSRAWFTAPDDAEFVVSFRVMRSDGTSPKHARVATYKQARAFAKRHGLPIPVREAAHV